MKNILFAISLLFLLVGCSPASQTMVEKLEAGNFEYIIIDGMPCVYDYISSGQMLSCDWSRWDGDVQDGIIVIPSEVPLRTSTYEP